MFKGLMDFSLTRTAKQASGFYLAYLLLGLLIAGLMGAVSQLITSAFGSFGPQSFSQSFAQGTKVGALTGIPYTLILGIVSVVKKRIGFSFYLLVVLSAIIAGALGMVIGLIPIAFITSRTSATVDNAHM